MKHTKDLLHKLWSRELKRETGEPIPDSNFKKAFDQIETRNITIVGLSILCVIFGSGWIIALITIYK